VHWRSLISDVQGSDAKDALLGRIFGYSAFSQAGRGADIAVANRLVASLISVMGKKSFLREAAANALVVCLEALPAQTLKHVLSSNELLQAVLTRKPEEATPEVFSASLHHLFSFTFLPFSPEICLEAHLIGVTLTC